MNENKYYDGTKLLSLKDINGNKPELYLVTTNRTGGKTTYFSRLCVNKFNEGKGKFMILYRFNYELDNCADKFYKDIKTLFFKGTEMTSKRRAKGVYHDLYIDDKHCGYAVALNNADQIKKFSHLFSDVARMFMDEFQSETNHYCPNEVDKFISIHTSVARGQGEQVREVPVYMCGNPVSMLNPYYTALNISARLDKKTRYLRGNGYILEQGYVDSASKSQQSSSFNKAFAKTNYMAYSNECVYLNDSQTFIEEPQSATSKYIATIRYNSNDYAIREYRELGILYCDTHADITYPMKISVTTDDHDINYVMLKANKFFIDNLRFYFQHGAFRFKDLKCKEAILKCVSY